jgi:hypothetical protein
MYMVMRLPDPLSRAVRVLSPLHARWHLARHPQRADLRGPGTEFPDLLPTDRRGSGKQFLEFHREMIMSFRKILAAHPSTGFAGNAWTEIPLWLVDFFSWAQPGFLDGALVRTETLVGEGTADDLGNFLESTLVTSEPFRGFHGLAHANIAGYEEQRFGRDHPFLRGAAMDRAETSPHNEHFWGLHGWIDDRYAELERRRNDAPVAFDGRGSALTTISRPPVRRDRIVAGERATGDRLHGEHPR